MNEQAIAQQLLDAHKSGRQFQSLLPQLGTPDLDHAYAVQRAFVTAMQADSGSAPVGYKIGLTSKRMQAMCGIDSPIAGRVLAHRQHPSGVVLSASAYGRIGLEFEIAVRLAHDLPASAAPYDMTAVTAAVGEVAPAVETVDDRHADYKQLDIASLVADNSWNAGIVLGDFRSEWPELATVTGVVRLHGVEVDRGFGSDVLGHPFEPLVWLANHLARTGDSLHAGDVVMTGSLVTTRFPTVTEAYEFDVSGLGKVAVTVTV